MASSSLYMQTPIWEKSFLLAHVRERVFASPKLEMRWQRARPQKAFCARANFSITSVRPREDGNALVDKLPEMPTSPLSTDQRSVETSTQATAAENSEHSTLAESNNEPFAESVGAPAAQSKDMQSGLRRPRSLQAIYLKPLKRKARYGLPACDLQLRSYNVRNVEFFADFALRAAYYLGLPASGPVPLPRIFERWTVPRSNFVHKKSQENFERITLRRLIQIQDANTEAVELWLAFLRKHAYYGIGMKANVWQHEKLGVGKTMDVSLENLKHAMGPKWAHFGRRKTLETSEKAYQMMKEGAFQEVVAESQNTA